MMAACYARLLAVRPGFLSCHKHRDAAAIFLLPALAKLMPPAGASAIILCWPAHLPACSTVCLQPTPPRIQGRGRVQGAAPQNLRWAQLCVAAGAVVALECLLSCARPVRQVAGFTQAMLMRERVELFPSCTQVSAGAV